MSRWPQVSVSSVCEIVKGGVDPQRHTSELFAHYSIPALDEGNGPAIEVGEAIKSQKTVIENEIVLVSKLNPRIPRVWLVDDEQIHRRICSTEFVPLKPDRTRLDLAYLAFAMRFALADGQISGSTSAATKSRERAKPNDLLRLSLPLPSLPEQRRIVDLLSRAEGIVRLRREAEKKAAELIPALFLDMFGDPATNPKGWPVATLGDVVEEFRYGTSQKSGPTGRPVLRIPNVICDRLEPADMKFVAVSEAEESRLRLRDGDMLFVRTNGNPDYVGRSAVFDSQVMKHAGFDGENSLYASYLIRARVRATIIPIFLQTYLSSIEGRRKLKERCRTSAGQFNINIDGLSSIPVPVPTKERQIQFSEQVRSIWGLLEQNAVATSKANAAFDALLAQAFSTTT